MQGQKFYIFNTSIKPTSHTIANPSKYDNKFISTLKLDVNAVLTSGNEKPF